MEGSLERAEPSSQSRSDAFWVRVARKLVREEKAWDEAHPDQKEQNPHRFRRKLTDDIRPTS